MYALITLVAGILAGWLITALYYRKSSRDQKSLLAKIPEEIRNALKEDQRVTLTVKDLNELLEQKTMNLRKKGLEAFKACPRCGSANIGGGQEWEAIDSDHAFRFNVVECGDCHWRKDDLHD
ncbi:MAG: hypothetical protein E4G89_07260 [Methanothrix sp.]|nr:MAG: hypothetical protein E4G89_07260 [Methanothrix sp.]